MLPWLGATRASFLIDRAGMLRAMTRSMEAHRILIVENEINARTALADLLRDEGFEVASAADGFEALGKLALFAPHVVITDLRMPGMDALELVTKLRHRLVPPAVIVMTAFGETNRAVDAMRSGARDYLTKPIRVDELLVVIAKTIEHYDLECEVDKLRRQEVGLSARARR
jgi:DNA-binding NtrC family response regulator